VYIFFNISSSLRYLIDSFRPESIFGVDENHITTEPPFIQRHIGNNSNRWNGKKTPATGPITTTGRTNDSYTPLISKAIISQIHISTANATMIAERAVGNGSHTVSANLGVENNFLVYTIMALDSNSNFHRVIVDAGT
jgi:hypothetical protein